MKKVTALEQELLNPIQESLSTDYFSENSILNHLPSAVYVCDTSGLIIKFNEQAVHLWGRRPIAGNKDDRYNGAFKLYKSDGSFLAHSQGPVAETLADGQPRKNIEMILEKLDKTRVHVIMNVVPIKDQNGKLIGVINCFNDITHLKVVENELAKKAKELQDYVDNAPVGLHWVDANGIIKWANKAELNMLGYSEEEYIGHHISEFHVSREKIDDMLTRLNCNEVLNQFEAELKCKDGSTKTVQITSNVYWEGEEFIHTRCFTVEITEQKKLLQQLITNDEYNKRILKNIPAAIYTCDKDGFVTFYNEEAVKLWGREPKIGKDHWCGSWNIKYPNGKAMPLQDCPMARCLRERQPIHGQEIVLIKPNGEERHVLPHPDPIFDNKGNLIGAVNMLIDITEAKKTEQTLRESEHKYRELASSFEKIIEAKTIDLKLKNEELKKSEERYHKMIDEVEDYAIILLDENGNIMNWNKGAEKIKGYKESEIVGKSFQVFYLPHDRESGLPLKLINRARTTGKAVHEGWRMRSDGTRFWGSIVLTALHNQNNEIIGFSKVTRDLTERKLAEDKLREYTSQLKFQNEQLEQFAYAASHDMKEPLRKILFYNSHLQETAAENMKEKEREYLNRSVNAAKKMERLINDLLEYSKAASDAHNFEQVDLNEVFDETILSHKDVIDEKGVVIENQTLPVVNGVAFQLRQVFDNLISNSIKYQHPERTLRIQIEVDKVTGSEIEELDPERTYHRIMIKDNGIGFEPEFSEKIFELFQRLGTNRSAGTGVGLALCKKITQNHHGTIKAKGEINVGASFEIYLPA